MVDLIESWFFFFKSPTGRQDGDINVGKCLFRTGSHSALMLTLQRSCRRDA